MSFARVRANRWAAATLLIALAPWAAAQSRGELLYSTHCVACHNQQMHWRDKKQVVDWASLRAQVNLWQATGLLAWSDDDINQVARHLNDTHYRFAPPSGDAAVAAAAPTPAGAGPRRAAPPAPTPLAPTLQEGLLP